MNVYNIKEPSFWHCDGCPKSIFDGEFRFNCTVCSDFDYCDRCFATIGPAHSHPMVRELAYGPSKRIKHPSSNMAEGIETAFDIYENRYCMGVRDVGAEDPSIYTNSYSWLTYKTVGERVRNFAHGLRNFIEPRGYLGVCAANRPEWMITDFACILQSIITVPMYCLFNDRETAFVINNTQISVIVCDEAMLPRLIQLGSECPSLRHIICMDPISESTLLKSSTQTCVSLHYMVDVERVGSTLTYEPVKMEPNDCMTIIYTSGSSGFPKGAIISEDAYRATFVNWFTSCLIERIVFCYRPLAWAADRDAAISTFLNGGRIGFSTGDVNRLMEELAIVRPTQFSAPPNIWNKIYAEYKAALSLIDTEHSLEQTSKQKRQLLKEFSKLIPERCRSLTVGSAKVSPIVLKFMTECFSTCRIFESYGITECGSVAYNNMPESTMQWRLESVPEMGYTVDDKPFPRGEILTKTIQMFSGYINNPEETHAALTDDGFFRTGDIVELRSNGVANVDVHVIDRRKNFFKLSQGQFVSPELLQGIYLQSPFVEQIYIHGDLLSDSVSAVVVPNRSYAQAFAREHHLENFDMNNPDPKFCDAVLQDLRSLGKKESLRIHEIPARLVIDFEPFTSENGLLTASLKSCRHKLAAYYGDRLKPTATIDQRLKSIIEMTMGQTLANEDEELFLVASGNDSLTAVRLSRTIEKDFGVSIPTTVLFQPNMTVQQLTTLIKDPSQISTISTSIVPQLWNDCQLDLNFTGKECESRVDPPSNVFVTGTTGFVGAFLLAELLNVYSSKCKFICLVRCESSIDPLNRILDNMLFYQVWKDEYRERIIPLRGDLAKPFFGLDNTTYESLTNQIDLIFHCGATVNFLLPYNKLYGPNVCGTREIIRLATSSTNYIPVQYISTISVLSSRNYQEVSIDQIPPDDLVTGYAQSKWVAEKLMSKASQLGLPVVIYRLGSIGAATESGSCNKNDLDTLFLAAIMKLESYPETALHSYFNSLPADFTAKSIVHLSAIQDNNYGKVYHVLKLTNRVPFDDILDGMQRCGVHLKMVSYSQWRTKLKTISDEDGSFQSAEEFLLSGGSYGDYTFSATEYCRAVSSLNCSSLDKDYVFKWLNFIFNIIIHCHSFS